MGSSHELRFLGICAATPNLSCCCDFGSRDTTNAMAVAGRGDEEEAGDKDDDESSSVMVGSRFVVLFFVLAHNLCRSARARNARQKQTAHKQKMIDAVPNSEVIYSEQSKELYDSVTIRYLEENSELLVHVGDCVAVASKASSVSSSCDKQGNPWYPWNQPWSPAQILSFQRTTNRSNNRKRRRKSSSGDQETDAASLFRVVIRWFWRCNELPNGTEIPRVAREGFLEWTQTETIPLVDILGRVEFSTKQLRNRQRHRIERSGVAVATVECRWRLRTGGLEQTNDWDPTHNKPTNRSGETSIPAPLLRGWDSLPASRNKWIPLAKQAFLNRTTPQKRPTGPPTKRKTVSRPAKRPPAVVPVTPAKRARRVQQQSQSSDETTQSSVQSESVTDSTPVSTMAESMDASSAGGSLGSQTSSMAAAQTVSTATTSKSSHTRVRFTGKWLGRSHGASFYESVRMGGTEWRIGDLVAVACESAHPPKGSRRPWFPFSQPWSPAQILSLCDKQTMVVRWFYRENEFEDGFPTPPKGMSRTKTVYETDRTNVYHIAEILGRVVMVDPSSTAKLPTKADGQTQVALSCTYSVHDGLREQRDWSCFDSSWLSPPLRRAMDCLKPRYRDVWKLTTDFWLAAADDASDFVVLSSDDASARSLTTTTTTTTSTHSSCNDKSACVARPTNCLHERDDGTKFFASVTLPPTEALASSTLDLELSVGDVICLQQDGETIAQEPMPHSEIPWTCGQLLNIYQKDSEIRLEIRSMHRRTELAGQAECIPPQEEQDSAVEEIFETDQVVSNVGTNRVLCKPHVLWEGEEEPKENAVCVRVRHWYCQDVQRFQPMFNATQPAQQRRRRLLERGYNLSAFNKEDDDLKLVLFYHFNFDLDSPPAVQQSPPQDSDATGGSQSTSIRVRWEAFVLSDSLWNTSDRSFCPFWTANVGQCVAIQCTFPDWTTGFESTKYPYYPFKVSWAPFRVVTIDMDNGSAIVTARRLTMRKAGGGECSASNGWSAGTEKISQLLEGPQTEQFDAKQLLGPISMLDDCDRYGNLPLCIYCPTCGSTSTCIHQGLLNDVEIASASQIPSPDDEPTSITGDFDSVPTTQEKFGDQVVEDTTAVEEQEDYSGQCVEDNDATAADAIEEFVDANNDVWTSYAKGAHAAQQHETPATPGDSTTNCGDLSSEHSSPFASQMKAWTSVPYFHQDFARLRSYYTEVDIKTPASVYTAYTGKEKFRNWTVRIGDVAIVHWDCNGNTLAKQTDSAKSASRTDGFAVRWAVCEVLALWNVHGSKATMRGRNHANTKLMAEIRWFYRKHELVRELKDEAAGNTQQIGSSECEEVLETDHVQEIELSSFLAPARLRAHPTLTIANEAMPTREFHCRRFWSLHRKNLVPVGSLRARVQRGLMYSCCIARDHNLKDALKAELAKPLISSPVTTEPSSAPLWKNAFRAAIGSLTLTEIQDANLRGMPLMGREEEHSKILAFVSGGIKSSVRQGKRAYGGSMFVAGPPGTGKTATVHSVMAQLVGEKTKGHLPEFEFVMINAMELRDPSEAYVRLWEAISGSSKERRPAEVAASKLQNYFCEWTGEEDEEKTVGQRRVVILLLDEIDYLVTKSQTVLYNFFDWPKRSAENTDGPQLIVIGISNTLNLPSRLKPSVESRLGTNRCIFNAYNESAIVDILKTKLRACSPAYSVFDSEAITFAARKVSALSGDLRTALKMCRVAAETVMRDTETGRRNDPKSDPDRPVVRIKDVRNASRESFRSVLSIAIATLSAFEALTVVALCYLGQQDHYSDGTDINELLAKVESIANGSGQETYCPPPTFDEVLDIVGRLGEVSF